MKNLKLILILILIVTCNIVSAQYVDEMTLQLLMHCDEAYYQGSWYISPDDNSSGRPHNLPILDKANGSWGVDPVSEPTLMPDSPYGGKYMHFDGVSNSVYVYTGWSNTPTVICDFSLRWLGYPPTNNPYAGLIQTVPWRSFLRPGGPTTCHVRFLLKDGTWINSEKYLNSNKWYQVRFSITNNTAVLIVGDTTNTVSPVSLDDVPSQIMIGNDIYRPEERFFYGDLDEIRIGTSVKPPPVYTDEPTLQLLAHCDSTNQGSSWLITPDDNSSGRDANIPILDKNIYDWSIDISTEPTLIPISPYGGNYMRFDGVTNSIYVEPGWEKSPNVICDFSFRWFGYPAAGTYQALVQTVPWRSFITRGGPTTCRLRYLVGTNWIYSTKYLNSNKWYDVHFSIIDDAAVLIIDETTNTLSSVSLTNLSSQITIGNDIFSPDTRFFYGDIDEIRIGYIPEPVSIYYLLFIIWKFIPIRHLNRDKL